MLPISSLLIIFLPAPFSYFNVMCHDPPTLVFGPNADSSRPGGDKDTAHNIKETGECVIHIISDWFLDAANHTSGSFPRGVDEFEKSGLTKLPSVKVF